MTAQANEDLRIAQLLAEAADAVTMRFFGHDGLRLQNKHDGSLVTEADLACEQKIRDRLHQLAPGAQVLGEEGGGNADASERWIIDPIDGTENFSRGNPVWGTLIAKEIGAEISVALISAPALGTRWWAARGLGSFCDGQRISVSRRAEMSDAAFAYGGLHECPSELAINRLVATARQFRCAWGWGNFWGHALVAQGVVDCALSHGVHIWDVAAPALLVAEAGGRWSGADGSRSLAAGSFLTSNGLLHSRLVEGLL